MKEILIKVYIWNGKRDGILGYSFGHASISLSDGTYISWWPSSDANLIRKAICTPGTYIGSLPEDIKEQGDRQPDVVFTLNKCVDENAIRRWWSSFKIGSSYSGVSQNCCWVVFQALREGSVLQLYPEDEVRKWEAITTWNQWHLKCFLKDLEKHIQNHEERKMERFICSICFIVLIGLLGLVLSKLLTFIIGFIFSRT